MWRRARRVTSHPGNSGRSNGQPAPRSSAPSSASSGSSTPPRPSSPTRAPPTSPSRTWSTGSSQSLRSFYQHFDGKHELLLALFEDALRRATGQIAAATEAQAAPIDALRTAVQLLFELSRPDPGAHRPLFTEFAPRLLLSHPAEVRRAHAPLLDLLTTLTARAADAGQLRPGTEPRRAAALTMETVMFTAQTSGGADPDGVVRPVTADEIWDFIAHGIAKA